MQQPAATGSSNHHAPGLGAPHPDAPGPAVLDSAVSDPAAPDFAALLRALAAPPARKREPAWSEDDLADDVATLSYESALRAHARYRPSDRFDGSLIQTAREDSAGQNAPKPALHGQSTARQFAPVLPATSVNERKSASITIRMSKVECEQLHRRAVEAGLTVSAYLRSCALEAESLRAQVKQALAEMRSAGNEGTPRHGELTEQENRNLTHKRGNWITRVLRRKPAARANAKD